MYTVFVEVFEFSNCHVCTNELAEKWFDDVILPVTKFSMSAHGNGDNELL